MTSSIRKASALLGILALTALQSAQPAGLASVPTLSSALALQAASAALESCSKAGFQVSVTVVDASGVVLTTLRGDGAAPHTVSTSLRKAYTSSSSHLPTSQLVKIVVGTPDAAGLRDIEGFLLLSGGLPIRAGKDVVGAIGVSGSPGPDSDEKCGTAGIAAISASLAR